MVRIENVVATAQIAKKLDLYKVEKVLDYAEYAPEMFPGLVYRSTEPKTTTLLFGSGQVVCTGGKNAEMAHETIHKIIKLLEREDISVIKDPKIKVQNIVATHDLKRELNLNSIAVGLGLERVEYEPEQFPGLVYRIEVPKAVMLLFQSGKIVCTGTKNLDEVNAAIDKLTVDLRQIGYDVG